MKKLCAFLIVGLLFALVGCSGEPSYNASKADLEPIAAPQAAARPEGAAESARQAGQGHFSSASASAPANGRIIQVSEQELAKGESSYTDRKIIRNAELNLQTPDPAAGQQRIESIAESLGGFLVDTDVKHANAISQSSADTTITITLRVPSIRFAQALEAIRGVGNRVIDEKESGQDVTEEYIDLESRIRTEKALEDQFLQIMKQARSVSDALEVQKEISVVRGEIERLEGRRRFLENKSALSTIKVVMQTSPPVITATQSAFTENLKQAVGDAVDTAAAIINGAIRVVGVMIPVTILILLPGALLIRFLWRRLPVHKPTPPVAQPE